MPLHGKIVVIKRSGGDGTEFPLTATCLFGRRADCDIRIQLPQISKEHCRIELNENKEVILTNLSALNPTRINGAPLLQSERLKHGDVITLIDRSFRFECPAPTPRKKRRSSAAGKAETLQVLQDQQVRDPATAETGEKRTSEVATDVNLKDGNNNGNIQRSLETTVEVESKEDGSLLQSNTASPFNELYQMVKQSLSIKTPRKPSEGQPKTPTTSRFCTPNPGSVRKTAGTPDVSAEVKRTPKKVEAEASSGTAANEANAEGENKMMGTPKSVKKQRRSSQVPVSEMSGLKGEENEPPEQAAKSATSTQETPRNKRRSSTSRTPTTIEATSTPQRKLSTVSGEVEQISAEKPKTPTRRRSKEATPVKPAVTKVQEEQAKVTGPDAPTTEPSPRRRSKEATPVKPVVTKVQEEQAKVTGTQPDAPTTEPSPRRRSKEATPVKPAVTKVQEEQAKVTGTQPDAPTTEPSPRRRSKEATPVKPAVTKVQEEQAKVTGTQPDAPTTEPSPRRRSKEATPVKPVVTKVQEEQAKVTGTQPDAPTTEPSPRRRSKEATPVKPAVTKVEEEQAKVTGTQPDAPTTEPSPRRRSKEATPVKPAVTKVEEEQAKVTGTQPDAPTAEPSPGCAEKKPKAQAVLLEQDLTTAENEKQKTTKKRRSGELGADTPAQILKRKRVSFGGQLSPELFDKRLPPDSPLRKGSAPRRSLCLVKPKQSLLRRASVIGQMKERLHGHRTPSPKKSPKAKTPSPGKKSPKAKTPSPGKKSPKAKTPSPGKKSPKAKTPSPGKKSPKAKTPSPGKKTPSAKTPSPGKKTPSAKTPSPGKKTPSTKTPSPGKKTPSTKTPSPGKKTPSTKTPSPGKKTPSTKTPSPGKKTPSTKTPSPGKKSPKAKSPSPARVKSPSPARVKSPSRDKSETPKAEKSPKPQRKSTTPAQPQSVHKGTPAGKRRSSRVMSSPPPQEDTATVTPAEPPVSSENQTPTVQGRFSVSRISTPSPTSEQDAVAAPVPCTAVTPKLPLRRKSMKSTSRKSQSGMRNAVNVMRRRSGMARASMKVMHSWADIVKLGQTKSQVVAPAKKTSTTKRRRRKVVSKPQTPAKKLKGHVSTGHAKSPVTIVVGKAVKQKLLPPTGAPPRLVYNTAVFKNTMSMDEDLTGVAEIFKTPDNARPRRSVIKQQSATKTPVGPPAPPLVEASVLCTPEEPGEMIVSPLSGASTVKYGRYVSEAVQRLLNHSDEESTVVSEIPALEVTTDDPSEEQCTDSKHATPKQKPEQPECLTGVKRLMKTPRQKAEPIEDLRGKLLRTPKAPQVADECLDGVKELLATPQNERESVEDPSEVTAVKTPVAKGSPLVCATGIKRLMRTPKQKNAPVEDMIGLKGLMQTPKAKGEPIEEDFGIDRLMKTPKQTGNAAVEDCNAAVEDCNAAVEDCNAAVEDCNAAVEDCNAAVEDCNAAVEDCEGLQELMEEPQSEQMETNEGQDQPPLDCGSDMAKEPEVSCEEQQEVPRADSEDGPSDIVENVPQADVATEPEVSCEEKQEVPRADGEDGPSDIVETVPQADVKEPEVSCEEQQEVRCADSEDGPSDIVENVPQADVAKEPEVSCEEQQEVPRADSEDGPSDIVETVPQADVVKEPEVTCEEQQEVPRADGEDGPSDIVETVPQADVATEPEVSCEEQQEVPRADSEDGPSDIVETVPQADVVKEPEVTCEEKQEVPRADGEDGPSDIVESVPQADVKEPEAEEVVCDDQAEEMPCGHGEDGPSDAMETVPQAAVNQDLPEEHPKVETATCEGTEMETAASIAPDTQKKSARGRRGKVVEPKALEGDEPEATEHPEDTVVSAPCRGRRGKKTESAPLPTVRQATRSRKTPCDESRDVELTEEVCDSVVPKEEVAPKPKRGRNAKQTAVQAKTVPEVAVEAVNDQTPPINVSHEANDSATSVEEAVLKPKRGRKNNQASVERPTLAENAEVVSDQRLMTDAQPEEPIPTVTTEEPTVAIEEPTVTIEELTIEKPRRGRKQKQVTEPEVTCEEKQEVPRADGEDGPSDIVETVPQADVVKEPEAKEVVCDDHAEEMPCGHGEDGPSDAMETVPQAAVNQDLPEEHPKVETATCEGTEMETAASIAPDTQKKSARGRRGKVVEPKALEGDEPEATEHPEDTVVSAPCRGRRGKKTESAPLPTVRQATRSRKTPCDESRDVELTEEVCDSVVPKEEVAPKPKRGRNAKQTAVQAKVVPEVAVEAVNDQTPPINVSHEANDSATSVEEAVLKPKRGRKNNQASVERPTLAENAEVVTDAQPEDPIPTVTIEEPTVTIEKPRRGRKQKQVTEPEVMCEEQQEVPRADSEDGPSDIVETVPQADVVKEPEAKEVVCDDHAEEMPCGHGEDGPSDAMETVPQAAVNQDLPEEHPKVETATCEGTEMETAASIAPDTQKKSARGRRGKVVEPKALEGDEPEATEHPEDTVVSAPCRGRRGKKTESAPLPTVRQGTRSRKTPCDESRDVELTEEVCDSVVPKEEVAPKPKRGRNAKQTAVQAKTVPEVAVEAVNDQTPPINVSHEANDSATSVEEAVLKPKRGRKNNQASVEQPTLAENAEVVSDQRLMTDAQPEEPIPTVTVEDPTVTVEEPTVTIEKPRGGRKPKQVTAVVEDTGNALETKQQSQAPVRSTRGRNAVVPAEIPRRGGRTSKQDTKSVVPVASTEVQDTPCVIPAEKPKRGRRVKQITEELPEKAEQPEVEEESVDDADSASALSDEQPDAPVTKPTRGRGVKSVNSEVSQAIPAKRARRGRAPSPEEAAVTEAAVLVSQGNAGKPSKAVTWKSDLVVASEITPRPVVKAARGRKVKSADQDEASQGSPPKRGRRGRSQEPTEPSTLETTASKPDNKRKARSANKAEEEDLSDKALPPEPVKRARRGAKATDAASEAIVQGADENESTHKVPDKRRVNASKKGVVVAVEAETQPRTRRGRAAKK